MAAQSTLKKPAAQQKAGMKRPAAHEKEEKPPKTHKKNGKDKEEEEEDDEIVEPLPLTEEALQSHNKFLSEMSKHKDMSQTQFDKTLATLPSRTAERLCMAFEACRKETGSDGQYKEASSGCGQQKKIKGPDNPTSQLLPKMSFNGFSGDREGRKDQTGGERSCMYVCMYVGM